MALYLQHFGLTEAPFSITPDPAFVYLSAAHREALAHLLYGVGKGGSGGFVQLTGEVGTGKTTICRCLLEQVPEDTLIALILNPLVTPQELLASICDELGVDTSQAEGSSKKMVDALNQYLLKQYAEGKRVVVVVDEAQNLSPEALEQVRLLTNLETAKHKLLQMVLLGQPELRQLLQRQNLRQLAQRITARYHLLPLNEQETFAYVKHRMRVAGARQSHFKNSALKAIYRRSGGVPRLINIIADRALAGAYAQEKDQVSAALVQAAADEVQPSESRVTHSSSLPWAWVALAAVVLGGAALAWQQRWLDSSPGPAATVRTSELATDRPRDKAADPGPVQPSKTQQAAGSPATSADVLEQSAPASSPVGAPAGPAMEAEPVTLAGSNLEPGVASGTSVGPSSSESLNAEQALATQSQPLGTLPLRDPEWSYPNAIQRPELTEQWLSDQHLLAYPALAQLWQEPALAKDLLLACEGAATTGFACLTEHGNWAKIRKLGLPVILVLRSNGDKHVLLRGLSDQHILLGAGSSPEWFARDQVDAMWMGEYLVAWPQSPDWPSQLRRGDSSTAVGIVHSMAALAEPAWQPAGVAPGQSDGQSNGQGVAQFDLQFENWIKGFQQREGLPADGIIGPQTLLYLMAPGIAEPRLQLAAHEGS